ncbi:ECF-type riboflavin transporter substrate-binding protein [Weissella viridescens]|uniref:ECF-type riboflavin transporter substrate-binding protein n=1 Tax=Weissella viridescens TaxID=1629 RepID=UPI001745D91E|nr:ECF-type riboflavin transporter substrate-binding protein [Weissella viridescens]QOD85514.1 ECF-type riboflavin transporter substrate-binding protein [Weissella viridescens]
MEKKNGLSTRSVVAVGIGTAVFIILFKFLAIPTGIANTQINVAQAWLSLIAAIFGPVVGGLVAFIGHALNDAISYGSIWWSWVIADGVFGVLIGLAGKYLHFADGNFTTRKIIGFNLAQLVSNIVAWLVVAPLGDILIYSEPAAKVFTQGGVSTLVNVISTAILGTAVLAIYNRTKVKKNSLEHEA